jgi:hypothetical protein
VPRSVRLLLALLAAAIGAWAGIVVIGGGTAGIAWLFLFGDDSWPGWAEPVILGIAILGAIVFAWRGGRSVWLALDKAAGSGNAGP